MKNLKIFFLIILNISIYSSLLSDTGNITLLKGTSISSDSSSQLFSNDFYGNIGLELPSSSYLITKIDRAKKKILNQIIF